MCFSVYRQITFQVTRPRCIPILIFFCLDDCSTYRIFVQKPEGLSRMSVESYPACRLRNDALYMKLDPLEISPKRHSNSCWSSDDRQMWENMQRGKCLKYERRKLHTKGFIICALQKMLLGRTNQG